MHVVSVRGASILTQNYLVGLNIGVDAEGRFEAVDGGRSGERRRLAEAVCAPSFGAHAAPEIVQASTLIALLRK
jgi:hypothetical protein